MKLKTKVSTLSPIIFAVICAVLVGCESSTSSVTPPSAVRASATPATGEGTSDPGGGGDIHLSSEEEVIFAIERARQFLLSEKGHRLLSFHLPNLLSNNDDPSEQILRTALEKISSPAVATYLPLSSTQFLKTDTEEKNCSRNPYKPYPDAYVSAFAHGADICFNIQRLRRLPKDSLYSYSVALWIHELAHLSGYDEPVAEVLGDFVLEKRGALSNPNIKPVLDIMIRILFNSYNHLMSTNDYLNRSMVETAIGMIAQMEPYMISLVTFSSTLQGIDALYAMDDTVPILQPQAEALIGRLTYARLKIHALSKQLQRHEKPVTPALILTMNNEIGCILLATQDMLETLNLYDKRNEDYLDWFRQSAKEADTFKCQIVPFRPGPITER